MTTNTSHDKKPNVANTFGESSSYLTKMRNDFYKMHFQSISFEKSRNDFTKEKIKHYIDILKNEDVTDQRKTLPPHHYYVRRRYAFVERANHELALVSKRDLSRDTSGYYYRIPRYVSRDEIFDIILLAHERSGHSGIKKTYEMANKEAKNIKMVHIRTFVNSCPYCIDTKRKRKMKPTVKYPIVSKDFGTRGQIDLIYLGSDYGQSSCQYIMNYQDNMTKFCWLKGLPDKSVNSMITAVTEVFGIIGAPKILQSDNGGEFRSRAFKNYFSTFWPDTQLIHSQPYNPKSQGSVERSNQEIKKILFSVMRMARNNDGKYDLSSHILPHVQYQKNIRTHRCLKCSPYKALFGRDPPVEMKFEKIYHSITENRNKIYHSITENQNKTNLITGETAEKEYNNNNNKKRELGKEEEEEEEDEGAQLVNRIESVRGNRNKVFQNIKLAAAKSISSP